ncbi:glycoside hydrolase family 98 domain-containing protein, partial [Ruminococcus sp.]|uniref:glycoside hydrolase family 98 domain-containing protein n=1 Tax=Ruminococcus sp. TaxID=41978 RepID=UPI00261B4356
MTAEAANTTMRRPCSPDQPMLIVHIDTWNYADPAKIIALIPEDLKPYVVFNISMSINWSNDSHTWLMTQNGYELAKSWLKTCGDEGVWCMVQPASGGQCHFPDYDSSGNIVNFPNKSLFVSKANDDYENTIYAEFFRDYPNFIGFNYSEQFWGFESADFPVTPIQRYQHFAKLLKLCNKYGGYLNVNWCANQWSPNINPIAMLKRCPEWRTACEQYSQNLQLEEKYTQASYIEDVESEILGAYLSGYCGNFGVRYDETGWTDSTWSGTGPSSKDQYRQITGLPIHMERMVLNGATIIDGPELIWADDFGESWNRVNDSEGYGCRSWNTKDQYVNDTLDFFRKVVDGTIRIPTRQEVIDRTKVVVIQDNNSGTDDNKYSTYETLFEGLYRMNGDGNLRNNHNLYKSTGRYPTIPTVYALRDTAAKSFQVQIKQSSIPSRWSSISAKQDEFNKLFASDYYGNCYAGRYENSWVTYNPNKDGSNCGAVLSLKYNTCKELDVNFNQYGNALIQEYSDHIDIY